METKMTSHGRKVVRVVARVKPSTDPVSTRSIFIQKPMGEDSESVSISFGEAQSTGGSTKDSYKLDYCYEENETTGLIFTKEIKPLISTVFEGKIANVIAHGARSSGKTHLIQGNAREVGLTVLAISEMLSMAEERGDSISVSVYEISQETVYDMLDQKKRVVSVLEGAQGRIQLKGLSQVPVKSQLEFQNLYFGLKKFQKPTSDSPVRNHRGVMVHVTTGNANSGSFGRMNFLDMAGYEDSRKQSNSSARLEIAKINKSIYALQNVLCSLNANEPHVPYRESKLTCMLKDCLQGCNRTLLITCLPLESSQDSIYMLNLASRICIGGNPAMKIPTKKKGNGLGRCTSLSSAAQKIQTPLTVSAISRKQTAISRKQTVIRADVSQRKIQVKSTGSVMKGRKLFAEANGLVKSKVNSKEMEGKAKVSLKKKISTSKVLLSGQASSYKEEVCTSSIVAVSESSSVEEDSALAFSSKVEATEPSYSTSASLGSEAVEITHKETPPKHEEIFAGATYCDDAFAATAQISDRDTKSAIEEGLTLVTEGENLEKENNSFLANESASPPLSQQLQALSNNLKSICKNSNQLSVPEKYQISFTGSYPEEAPEYGYIMTDAVGTVEPRTPDKTTSSNIGCSPWKTYSAHSSKLKKSAVGEYLKFINTAEKEELKKLKGIGEKRATYIVELREESPFKTLDDLQNIGLSAKQVKGLLKKEIGEIVD